VISLNGLIYSIIAHYVRKALHILLAALVLWAFLCIFTGCATTEVMCNRESYYKQLYYHIKYTPLTYPWEDRYYDMMSVRI
jgi:hypothetical protein